MFKSLRGHCTDLKFLLREEGAEIPKSLFQEWERLIWVNLASSGWGEREIEPQKSFPAEYCRELADKWEVSEAALADKALELLRRFKPRYDSNIWNLGESLVRGALNSILTKDMFMSKSVRSWAVAWVKSQIEAGNPPSWEDLSRQVRFFEAAHSFGKPNIYLGTYAMSWDMSEWHPRTWGPLAEGLSTLKTSLRRDDHQNPHYGDTAHHILHCCPSAEGHRMIVRSLAWRGHSRDITWYLETIIRLSNLVGTPRSPGCWVAPAVPFRTLKRVFADGFWEGALLFFSNLEKDDSGRCRLRLKRKASAQFATEGWALVSEGMAMPPVLAGRVAWLQAFGRAPLSPVVRDGLNAELITNKGLHSGFKFLSRILKTWGEDMVWANRHKVLAAARLAAVFGGKVMDVTRGMSPQGIHDAGINLPDHQVGEEEKAFLLKNRKKEGGLSRAAFIIGRASAIRDVTGKGLGSLTLEEAEAACSSLVFDNAKDLAFAVEAAKWTSDHEAYLSLERRWTARDVRSESVPAVTVEQDGYRMSRLHRDDPRALFAGAYTNCCQHPAGVGSQCAWHAVESGDGAIFVVEKNGKIIAQSWTWRSGDTLCFDNVEALSSEAYAAAIRDLYLKAAAKLAGTLGVKRVLCGTGYDDLWSWDHGLEYDREEFRLPPRYNGYTDASSARVILAEVPA